MACQSVKWQLLSLLHTLTPCAKQTMRRVLLSAVLLMEDEQWAMSN
jgi:hypothetical protein